MKASELRTGMQVRIVLPSGKLSIPMTVVGIFSSLTYPDKADVYLDFEGNPGDVWEITSDELELDE